LDTEPEPDSIIYVDGASRGNPGEASYGFLILDRSGQIIHQESGCIGVATNNVAEYRALIRALEEARERGILSIEIRSDSQLLVRQLLGEYKVRAPNLIGLHERCKNLLRSFRWYKIRHIPREENRQADRLANEALNRMRKKRS